MIIDLQLLIVIYKVLMVNLLSKTNRQKAMKISASRFSYDKASKIMGISSTLLINTPMSIRI